MVRLAGRAVTDYGYNDTGLRITETTTTDGGTPQVKSFLFDTRNPTGFTQVLEEYIDGVLKQVFTIGHDVIAQTDVTNPQDQDGGRKGDILLFTCEPYVSSLNLCRVLLVHLWVTCATT